MEQLMSPKQAAAHYGVTQQTIYSWVKKGILPAVRFGRTIRIRADVLDGEAPRDRLARTLAQVVELRGGEIVENPLDALDRLTREAEETLQDVSVNQ